MATKRIRFFVMVGYLENVSKISNITLRNWGEKFHRYDEMGMSRVCHATHA